MRAKRAWRYIRSSGVSAVTPIAPYTWIARSMVLCSIFAPTTLMTPISTRAGSPVSILCAACSVRSRHAWISAAVSKIITATCCFSPSVVPNATRELARSHIRSNARCAWPSQRMQWKMRPGPSRCCAIRNPCPRGPSRFARGTRTLSYSTSQWPLNIPITGVSRTMLYPGVSVGTTIMLNAE